MLKTQRNIKLPGNFSVERGGDRSPEVTVLIEVSFNGNTTVGNHNRRPSELCEEQQKSTEMVLSQGVPNFSG